MSVRTEGLRSTPRVRETVLQRPEGLEPRVGPHGEWWKEGEEQKTCETDDVLGYSGVSDLRCRGRVVATLGSPASVKSFFSVENAGCHDFFPGVSTRVGHGRRAPSAPYLSVHVSL